MSAKTRSMAAASETSAFCRRCGQPLQHKHGHVFVCPNAHTIYMNASPAVAAVCINDQRQCLISIRGIEPSKGKLDLPGGFCDGAETLELALARELHEELGLSSDDYQTPEFVLSEIDTYEFEKEDLHVLTAIFLVKLRPGVTVTASDDITSAKFCRYDEIDQSKLPFPSCVAALKQLHKQGVL